MARASLGSTRRIGWRAAHRGRCKRARFGTYLEDQLNFVVASGTIDVQSTYKFSLTDQVNMALNVSKATVSDLAVRPKDSDTDWVSLPALDMTDAAVDLAQHSASIDSLSLTGLKVLAWLEPGGAVNLLKLALPAAHPGAAPAAAPAATATASATATSPWTVNLREFAVREAQHFSRGSDDPTGCESAARAAIAHGEWREPRLVEARQGGARRQGQRDRLARRGRARSRRSRWRRQSR